MHLYPIIILAALPVLFIIELFFRVTGLIVHRYYTAIMCLFYIVILPLATIFLLTSSQRWALLSPLPANLMVIGALTVGFYLYASIRLLRFNNAARNLPEIYHHLIFAVFISLTLFVQGYARIICGWLFLQQYSIVTYYLTYIFQVKSETTRMRFYLIHYCNFFVVKLLLLVAIFVGISLHFTPYLSHPFWIVMDASILVTSLTFNLIWFIQMTPKALRYMKILKSQR